MLTFRLCEEEISSFDPLLHKKHFMEYLKHLLVCYDEIDLSTRENSLIDHLQNLNIENDTTYNLNNRSLLESIYILSNLGDPNGLLRFLSLPQKIK